MALIYDESVRSVRSNISINNMDGTKAYLRHYESKLTLCFFATYGSPHERWQAEKELKICERKLRFWENHPNFVGQLAREGMEKLNNDWKGRRAT
ncbi:hypothetical protein HJB53_30110 [Rhizobium lentis]|uniref:hypothetical protein n=1 Tax=Rhizobium lentis TaxID=1138194 RepID=UPI001C834365|nr:hypothetical protein [Rhizobium lentis]MBX5130746.1 hypothetical protein [Rhizobium lentis]